MFYSLVVSFEKNIWQKFRIFIFRPLEDIDSQTSDKNVKAA